MARRVLGVLMTVAVAGFGLASGGVGIAAATASLKLSATGVPPGGTVQVSGAGFRASESVAVALDATALGTVQTTSAGTFSVAEKVPLTTLPGPHSISAVGQTSSRTAKAAVSVRVNWAQGGFGPSHWNLNPLENVLSASVVANLVAGWKVAGSGSAFGSPVDSDGRVFQPCLAGGICAYNQTTGVRLWRSATADDQGIPAVGTGRVFSAEGYCYTSSRQCQFLHAYNEVTGATLWTKSIPASGDRTPLVVGSKVYVTTNFTLRALNPATGAIIWIHTGTFDSGGPAYTTGALIVGGDGGVAAFNPSTGQKLWTLLTPNVTATWAPLVSHGVVYVADQSNIEAVDLQTKAVIWSATAIGPTGPLATDDEGTLYVGTLYGLTAYDAATGAALWTASSGKAVTGSPVIADGVLYYATGTTMIAADAATGHTLWTTALGSGVQGTPIVTNGRLWAITDDGALHSWHS